jgi:peptide/nickel transport system permease protein
MIPGFILGNLLGIALGLSAARRRGQWVDRVIGGLSVTGMSISFLVIIILLQLLLSTPYGLNLFPVRGWQVVDLPSYLYYVTVPSLSLILVTLGYNTRFYRAVFVEESGKDHITTARAYGIPPAVIMWKHVLKNSMVPIITRIMFSIPLVVISGSLLIETYFGIPGVGKVTFDAITSGDQPILKAVVGLTAVAFVLIQLATDLFYRLVDPRIA